MSGPQTLPLLVPKQLQSIVVDGGSEIVIEKRSDEQRRFFLHVFDEAERREAIRSHARSSCIHERALGDLQWARATLWNDIRLQQYFYSHDWMTWPSLPELSSMVNLVLSAKETDDVPDFDGAKSLKKALNLFGMEILYPGLHPLKEEVLAGPLLAFHTSRTDDCVVGDTMHALVGERDQQQCIGNSVWLIDLSTASFTPDEVIRLPLTMRVQEECLQLMQPGLSMTGLNNEWSAVVQAHHRRREEHGLSFFCSIPDALLQFGMAPVHLAKLMCEAAEQGSRIRLRVGMYISLLQRREVFVITSVSGKSAYLDVQSDVMASFEEKTGQDYENCAAAGIVIRVVERETLEETLRLRFLSPLASEVNVVERISLTPTTQLSRVVVRHNPFAIVHGPRVVGTFPENCIVRNALSELLSSREGSAPASTSKPSEESSMPMTTVPTSTALTGEQLRRALDEAVFKTLSVEPMTKIALSAHGNMTRFRSLANFEAILKDSLKRNAAYRGKKYYLKE